SKHMVELAKNDIAHPSGAIPGPIPPYSSAPEDPFGDWRGWQPQDRPVTGPDALSTELSSRTIKHNPTVSLDDSPQLTRPPRSCPHDQEYSKTAVNSSMTCILCVLADVALAAAPPNPRPRRNAVSAEKPPAQRHSSQTSQLVGNVFYPPAPSTAPAPAGLHRVDTVMPSTRPASPPRSTMMRPHNSPSTNPGFRGPSLMDITRPTQLPTTPAYQSTPAPSGVTPYYTGPSSIPAKQPASMSGNPVTPRCPRCSDMPTIQSGQTACQQVPPRYPNPSTIRCSQQPGSAASHQVTLHYTTPPITPCKHSGPSFALTETSRRIIGPQETPASALMTPLMHRRIVSTPARTALASLSAVAAHGSTSTPYPGKTPLHTRALTVSSSGEPTRPIRPLAPLRRITQTDTATPYGGPLGAFASSPFTEPLPRRILDCQATPPSTRLTHERTLSSPITLHTPSSSSVPSAAAKTNGKRKRAASLTIDADGESTCSEAESLQHPAPKRRRPIGGVIGRVGELGVE
ncbi:MAG: hypothetical protein Q9184_004037, partial [Pyrenodesmia sp. 2 TL-2023]